MKKNRIYELQYGGQRGYYTTPYQGFGLSHTPFIPQYAGAPLKEVQAVGEGLTEAYYNTLSEATKLDMLNQEMQAIEGDSDEMNKIKHYYSGEIESMAKSGNWEDLFTKVNKLGRKWVGDPIRQALMQTKTEFEKEQEDNRQRRLRGLPPLEFSKDPSTYKTISRDEEGNVDITPYVSQAEGWRDVTPEMEKLFNQMLPNAYQSILQATKDTPMGMLSQSAREDITLPRIKAYLDGTGPQYAGSAGGFEKFKNTDAFKFRKKQLMWNPSTQEFDNMTEAQATQQIYDELLATGTEKIYQKFGIDYTKDPTFDSSSGSGGGRMPAYEELGARQVQGDLGVNVDMFHPDKEVWSVRGDSDEYNVWVPGSGGIAYRKEDKETYKQEHQEEFDRIVNIATDVFNSDKKPSQMSDLEKFEIADKYSKLVENRARNNKILKNNFQREFLEGTIKKSDEDTPSLIKRVEEDLVNSLKTRALMDYDTGMVFQMIGKDDELTDQYKSLVGKDVATINNIKLIGEITPYHHLTYANKNQPSLEFADAYVVEVRDPESSKVKTLLVERSDSSVNSPIGRVNQQINQAYNAFNVKPGMESTVNIFGIDVTGKSNVKVLPNNQIQHQGLQIKLPGDTSYRYFADERQLVLTILHGLQNMRDLTPEESSVVPSATYIE